MRIVCSVFLMGVLGWAVTAQAAPIHIAVDLDSNRTSSTNAGVPPLNTQGGFTSWDVTTLGTTAGANVKIIDGITFELFGWTSTQPNFSRGRAEENQTPHRSLTRDFVFNEGANGRAVGLRITGLDLGATYQMRSWHWDSVVASTQNFTQIEVRGAGVGGVTTVLEDMRPWTRLPEVYKFTTTAPGVVELIYREDDVVIDLDPDSNRARLNGFIIKSVPEPSSVCLTGLAFVAIALGGARGRRRK